MSLMNSQNNKDWANKEDLGQTVYSLPKNTMTCLKKWCKILFTEKSKAVL